MNKSEYIVEYSRYYKSGDSDSNTNSFGTYDEAKQYVCNLTDTVVAEYKAKGYDVTKNIIDDRYNLIAGSYDIVTVISIISKPYGKYVYVMRTAEAYNCTVVDDELRVFKSREKALQAMQEFISELKDNSRFYDNVVLLDKYTVAETEDSFIIKEIDSYDNGIEIDIIEVELED